MYCLILETQCTGTLYYGKNVSNLFQTRCATSLVVRSYVLPILQGFFQECTERSKIRQLRKKSSLPNCTRIIRTEKRAIMQTLSISTLLEQGDAPRFDGKRVREGEQDLHFQPGLSRFTTFDFNHVNLQCALKSQNAENKQTFPFEV